MDNLRLYALCAYANSVTDFDLVEKATKRKRRVKRLHIMEALDDRLAKLLILANPEKPPGGSAGRYDVWYYQSL